MTLRSAARLLLVIALALPVAQAVLVWASGLLRAMDDAPGVAILAHVSTACQVVWAIDLVGLVIVLAMIVLNEQSPPNEDSEP